MRARLQRLALALNGVFGRAVPARIRASVRRMLFPEDTRPRRELLVDVVGACNLRCPSCPVANVGQVNPGGRIDTALFERIIAKAAREYGIYSVSLFNWAEPLLHPDIAKLVGIVKAHGLPCGLSSNLNYLRNPREILGAQPDFFRISVSGFGQEVYGRTHVRGDVERVKTNMADLARVRRELGDCRTKIEVYYHKYMHNLADIRPMRDYAQSLGFTWLENWAYYMPVEKAIELARGGISLEEKSFVEAEFALPIVEALRVARTLRNEPCPLSARQLVLDVQGDVQLCCAVYDSRRVRLGSFLEMSPSEISAAKAEHAMCSTCMELGVHIYATFLEHDEARRRFDALAKTHVGSTAVASSEVRAAIASPGERGHP